MDILATMEFLGIAQVKKEVNQVQKYFGMKKSDTPVFIIYFFIVGVFFIGLILGIILLVKQIHTPNSPPPQSGAHVLFKKTQTVYSNIVPTTDDIIDLDYAGNLIPAPYNVPFVQSSSSGVCAPQGEILPYSQGIVLVLNLAPLISSHDFKDPDVPARAIAYNQPPLSSYFTFRPGDEKEITTGGRTFLVKLSRMEDLTTAKNGYYFSYIFDINENSSQKKFN